MIITCPKCKTKFNVDDELISPEGTKFSCYNCSFKWLEKGNQNPFPENTIIPIIDDKHDERHIRRPTNYHKLSFMLILIFSVTVVSLLIMTILDKDLGQNVKEFSSVFKKVKPSVNNNNLLLEIEKPVKMEVKENKQFLKIKGFVKNKTMVEQNIPALTVDLKNSSGKLMQRVDRRINGEKIDANQEIEFLFYIERFSKTITNVEVNFSKEEEKKEEEVNESK